MPAPGSFSLAAPSFYAGYFEDPESISHDQQGYLEVYHRSVYSQVATENLSFIARVIKRWGEDPSYLVGSPIWVSIASPTSQGTDKGEV